LVVTFSHWRIIFWVQVAMAGLGLVLSLLFVPEIEKREAEGKGETRPSSAREVLSMFNPVRILRQWLYPNVLLCVCNPVSR
jgi:predicted MFS family arabinose efflux permease